MCLILPKKQRNTENVYSATYKTTLGTHKHDSSILSHQRCCMSLREVLLVASTLLVVKTENISESKQGKQNDWFLQELITSATVLRW